MSYADIIIPFIGGLALFIYGMNIMAEGLQNAAGNRMKQVLEALTQNRLMGIALGALVTAIIQSSSATTVMIVGFVNAGLMNLTQAMSVIMGANIGTTATGWIVSSGEWAKFLDPTTLAPLAVMIGVILLITSKSQKKKEISSVIIGFGILFIGISTMSDAVYPLRESALIVEAFSTLGSNPILGILTGAIVTAIIQSSSASQGILLSLAATGVVPVNAAVYIIMGQNIGTCITAILSGIGASKNAKCVGTMHLLFNIVGTIVFSIFAIFYFRQINPAAGDLSINQTMISAIHTLFNIGTTLIMIPLSNVIIHIAMKINGVSEKTLAEKEPVLLHMDERMLETPSIAIDAARKEVVRMGLLAEENLKLSVQALNKKDHEIIEKVKQQEDTIDRLCDSISGYLVKLCSLRISQKENDQVISLLNAVSDMERIGDHAENIAELAETMTTEGVAFSQSALDELNEMLQATYSSYSNALKALSENKVSFAEETVRYEAQVDQYERKLRASHINRLSSHECNTQSGICFLDMLTNLERVSDHAMNIAQLVLNEQREDKKYHDETLIANV